MAIIKPQAARAKNVLLASTVHQRLLLEYPVQQALMPQQVLYCAQAVQKIVDVLVQQHQAVVHSNTLPWETIPAIAAPLVTIVIPQTALMLVGEALQL